MAASITASKPQRELEAEPEDTPIGEVRPAGPPPSRRGRLTRLAATILVFLTGLASLQGRVSRSPDAQLLRDIVERFDQSAGSLYSTELDNNAPVWIALYRGAYQLAPSPHHFWWVIAAISIALAAVIARLLVVIGEHLRLPAPATRFAATLVFLYLVFGPEQLSGSVHPRMLVVVLELAALAMFLRTNRRNRLAEGAAPGARLLSRHAVMASGLMLGLAIQTGLGAAIGGLFMGFFIQGMIIRKDRRATTTFGFIAAVVFGVLAAAAWYSARGTEPEFVNIWYRSSRLFEPAVPLTTAFETIGSYYLRHLPHLAIIVTFVLISIRRWKQFGADTKFIRLGAVGWLLAELAPFVLSGPVRPTDWASPLAPVLLMGVFVAADLASTRARRRSKLPAAAKPALLALGVTAVLTAANMAEGMATIVEFDSFEATHQATQQPG